MKFRIASTFTDSLAKLTRDEKKAAKITAFDLQLNPINPGMQLHKITHSRDKNFWSARIGRDLRLIIHKTEDNFLLCYVGHHDEAYAWANRRKIEKHPKTGAAQIVVIPERVEPSPAPQNVPLEAAEQPRATYYPGIFLKLTKDDLLSVGVPPDALDKVRNATEQDVDWIDYVPSEAGEALLDYHASGVLKVPEPVAPGTDPFDHPDARRRFRVIGDEAELQRALAAPWAQWALFLHPSQREYVERDYDGPTRIAGVAGTGKTIVAIHRAAHLARKNPDANILLTSILYPLIDDLSKRMDLLVGHDPDVRQRITVRSLRDVGTDLYQKVFGELNIIEQADESKINSVDTIATSNKISAMLEAIAPDNVPMKLLRPEWYEVVDAWQVRSLEAYRNAPRLGRMTQLTERHYQDFWGIFEQLRAQLKEQGFITTAEMFGRLTDHFRKEKSPFDFIIADEAQDISVPQMRLLGVLGGGRPNGLFFCGDLGQRIYQQPFSQKLCGVDIGYRSHILRKNYRTSLQIQKQVERLLPSSLTDVDGHSETRERTQSAFNGPEPIIQTFDDGQKEIDFITQWLSALINDNGVAPDEIAIFVRVMEQLERASSVINAVDPRIVIDVMQNGKGLEFRAVVLMACNEGVVPSQDRLERYLGDLGIGEIYNTERQLLYVAATRAREHLLITGVKPASEFLNDLI